MNNSLSLAFILLMAPLFNYSQEYSYTRYDSKDGLAGSTVYCIVQDKEGFIWMATETGLSRFDGTHFRNFTREDGLPDNDVIQLFADSKGRLWISPFKKTVCYYYKGVIHNSENDPQLKKLSIQDNVVRFAEDRAGNILMQEKNCLHLVQPDGTVTAIKENFDAPYATIELIAGRKAGGFWVMMNGGLYVFKDNRLTLWRNIPGYMQHFTYAALTNETLVWRSGDFYLSCMSLQKNTVMRYPYKTETGHINIAAIDDHYTAGCTQNGAFVYNINEHDSIQHYLPGIQVSNMLKDTEGNWWFSTFGNGIYRLNSGVALNQRFGALHEQELTVTSFLKYKNWILAGTRVNALHKLSLQTGKLEGRAVYVQDVSSPITDMLVMPDNRVLVGTKHFLAKLTPGLNGIALVRRFVSVKAIVYYRQSLLVGSDRNILLIDPATFKILDTVWNERATCLYADKDTAYIGTLNGMYRLCADTMQNMSNTLKPLQTRIAADITG